MNHTVRLASAGLALLLGTSVLVGCSGPAEQSSTNPTVAATNTNSAPATDGQKDTLPSMGDGFVGISGDVSLNVCDLPAGPAKAEGTVKNSGAEPRDVMVAVLWMNAANDAVSIKVFTQKAVPAGETVNFALSTELPADATRCQLNAKANKVGSLP